MNFLQAINSDLSVLIVCNKTGGNIKGDIYKKNWLYLQVSHRVWSPPNPLSNRLQGVVP